MEMFGNGASAEISKPAASAVATAAVDQTNDIAILARGRGNAALAESVRLLIIGVTLDDLTSQYEWTAARRSTACSHPRRRPPTRCLAPVKTV